MLYIFREHDLVAIDTSGKTKWTKKFTSGMIDGGLAASNGLVYTLNRRELSGLDAVTGDLR
jgi:outer membrane protein assembly factor BamB